MMSIAPIMPGEVRKITVDEFIHLAESGFFKEEERVELADGVLYAMSPQGIAHNGAVARLNRWLSSLVGDSFIVRVQSTVQISDVSAVEPDVAVLAGNFEQFDSRHPNGDDVKLVIEVADWSLAIDVHRKMILYAQARIPEYWIVDLKARRLLIHTDPRPDGYRMIHLLDEFQEISPQIFPEATIEVIKLLPTKTGH